MQAANRSQAEVDAHEDRVLRSEEERTLAKAVFSWHDNGDGTTSGHFTLPSLPAAILIKTLQQLASPRRATQAAARKAKAAQAAEASEAQADTGTAAPHAGATASGGRGVTTAAGTAFGVDDTTGEDLTGWERDREATWQQLKSDGIDWKHRYGQALAELLEHLPTDKLTGKVAATVVVTIDHDQLKNSLGAAHLDTGHDLSAGQARRIACNAGLIPAVLAGDSLPLDLGRQERFFTEHQRLALATTYDTCTAQACDRPYAWTELHHQDPWAQDGQTNLHLAVPLCGHHHRRIHDPRYHHHIHTDRTGKKTATWDYRGNGVRGRSPRLGQEVC